MDPETGKFSMNQTEIIVPPINYADIVVIDECSMVNEEALKFIMLKKPYRCKIIFADDIGQLPPIRESHHYDADRSSPTFDTENKALLTTRIRQGEESPILPYADLFWNNSQLDYPSTNPASNAERVSIVMDKGSLVFSRLKEAIDKVMHLFLQAVNTGNQDIIKIIVYKNNTRRITNNMIRKRLFGDTAEKQFVPGDLLMFYDNYGFGMDAISNSTELQVKTVEQSTTEDNWNIFDLGVSIDGKPRQLLVLMEDDTDRFRAHLQALANQAKALPKGPSRSEAWKKYYKQKERFAPVEHAYAITSHKCQGSTYDVAIIAEADIMAVLPTSNKSKSQSIYTSITRARHLSVILDGYTHHDGELDQALSQINIMALTT